MDQALVLPPTKSPRKRKESNEKTKGYSSLMLKFFGGTNTLVKSIAESNDAILTTLIRMFEVVEEMYNNLTSKFSKDDKDRPESDKKKDKQSKEKWYKVLKTKFFDKTLNFLKSMASVNFITTLITFLLLLKMGILQRFIPYIANVIGDAIKTLIKWVPIIAKFIFNLLWKTIPKILKDIFRTALNVLGLDNPIIAKFTDLLAQFLPITIAGTALLSKLTPFFSVMSSVFTKTWSVLKFIGAGIMRIIPLIIPAIKTLIAFFSTTAGIVLAIVAALVIAGILIYKYRKEIANFFIWLWGEIKEIGSSIGNFFGNVYDSVVSGLTSFFQCIKEGFIRIVSSILKFFEPVIEIFKSILNFFIAGVKVYISIIKALFKFIWVLAKVFYKLVIEPIIKGITWLGKAFFNYVITPIVNGISWLGGLFYDYIITPFIAGLKWLGGLFYDYVVTPFLNGVIALWEGIKSLPSRIYTNIISPVINSFIWISSIITTYIISPISKFFTKGKKIFKNIFGHLIKWVIDKFKSLMNAIVDPIFSVWNKFKQVTDKVIKPFRYIFNIFTDFISTIGTRIKSVVDVIKSTFDSMLTWFGNIATYGYKWFTMNKVEKDAIIKAEKEVEGDKTSASLFRKVAEGEIAAEVAKEQIKGNKEEKDRFEKEAKEYKEQYEKFKKKSEDNEGKTFAQFLGEQRYDHRGKSYPERLSVFILNDTASNQ